MTDYAAIALALMPECACNSGQYYPCTLCDGTQERRCARDDIATALRKAVEDAREEERQYFLQFLKYAWRPDEAQFRITSERCAELRLASGLLRIAGVK